MPVSVCERKRDRQGVNERVINKEKTGLAPGFSLLSSLLIAVAVVIESAVKLQLIATL